MAKRSKTREQAQTRREKRREARRKAHIRKTGYVIAAVVTLIVVGTATVLTFYQPSPTDENESATTEIEWLEYEEGIALSQSEDKTVMIDFYGYDKSTDYYCPPCKQLDETTYTNSAVIEKSKEFVCIKVNCWDEGNTSLCSSYAIEGVPTIVFLNSEGYEVHRFVGYRDADAFLEEMNKALTYS